MNRYFRFRKSGDRVKRKISKIDATEAKSVSTVESGTLHYILYNKVTFYASNTLQDLELTPDKTKQCLEEVAESTIRVVKCTLEISELLLNLNNDKNEAKLVSTLINNLREFGAPCIIGMFGYNCFVYLYEQCKKAVLRQIPDEVDCPNNYEKIDQLSCRLVEQWLGKSFSDAQEETEKEPKLNIKSFMEIDKTLTNKTFNCKTLRNVFAHAGIKYSSGPLNESTMVELTNHYRVDVLFKGDIKLPALLFFIHRLTYNMFERLGGMAKIKLLDGAAMQLP